MTKSLTLFLIISKKNQKICRCGEINLDCHTDFRRLPQHPVTINDTHIVRPIIAKLTCRSNEI